MANEAPASRRGLRDIAAMAAVVTAVAATSAVVIAAFWIAYEGFIIIFAGILFAVLLDSAAYGLQRLLGWRSRVNLMVVFVVTAVLIIAGLSFGGSILASQANHFLSAMKGLVEEADRFIQANGLGLFPRSPPASSSPWHACRKTLRWRSMGSEPISSSNSSRRIW